MAVPAALTLAIDADLATVSCGAANVLAKTQVKSAPATTLAAGMVSVVPDTVPIDPVLPVMALLASVQEAVVKKKPAALVSVKYTAVPTKVTLMAVGEAGVAVPAATVVMPAGALARLVCAKVKAPPKPPVVIFCTLTVGILRLVKRQVKSAPATTFAAGMVSVVPVSVPMLPEFPVMALLASVQEAERSD